MRKPAPLLAFALAFCCVQCASNRHSSPAAQFQLHEMDMHLHAGTERQQPMDEWLKIAAANGRRAVLLVDHLELYRKAPEEYAAWAREKNFKLWYGVGAAGHAKLMADFDAAIRNHPDMLIFKGWEVYEGELDTGVEADALRLVDCIGWHISPNNGREAPNGTMLINRIKQIKELQKSFPMPMILYHPFTMRVENLQRTAVAQGRDPKSITRDDYRFFTTEQQNEVIVLLEGEDIYIEMTKTTFLHWGDDAVREALIADIRPLAAGGVQFTVSTDDHSVLHSKQPFRPDIYCPPCGITPENTNGIICALIEHRAKRQGTK